MSQNSGLPPFDFGYCSDKTKVFKAYCEYNFARTQSMFVYKNLPDTIPVQSLEEYLQRNGSCCIAEHNGKIYALLGNAGGELDEYYQPTIYTVANPALNLSKTYTIGEDCVYCRNDYNAVGLTPLICRYSGLMTENLLTVRLADINMRMMNLLSAPDDNTVTSAKKYLKDLEEGKLGVVGETPFFDGLKLQSKSIGSGDYMIQFIELQQYLKGSMYNELGINANFNMKREALSGQEVALNDDALMPLIDEMLKQRRNMCDAINEMFGLNVSVEYGSTWHSNIVEKQLVGSTEFNATESGSEEFGGDEASLPADKDSNSIDSSQEDVSRLKGDDKDGNENPNPLSSPNSDTQTDTSGINADDDSESTDSDTPNSEPTSKDSSEQSEPETDSKPQSTEGEGIAPSRQDSEDMRPKGGEEEENVKEETVEKKKEDEDES